MFTSSRYFVTKHNPLRNTRPIFRRGLATVVWGNETITTTCDLSKLSEHARCQFVDLYSKPEDLERLLAVFSTKFPPHSLIMSNVRELFWPFLTRVDTASILGMHEMQVLETAAARQIFNRIWPGREDLRVLDVGSGTGGAVLPLLPFVDRLVCTDSSFWCVQRARSKGLHILQIDDLSKSPECDGPFDLICLQNVLDRCSKPSSLLQQSISRLSSQGCVLVAMAMPYTPFVAVSPLTRAFGWSKGTGQTETLEIYGESWELQVNSLLENVLIPAGLKLQLLTRVPYLCQATQKDHCKFYHLDVAVLVVSKK